MSKLNKRTRLSISIASAILFFLLFQGIVDSAAQSMILFVSSAIYGLGVLRALGSKAYVTLIMALGLISALALPTALSLNDNGYEEIIPYMMHFIYVFIGTPTMLVSMYFMRKPNKRKKDLV